MSLLNIRPIEPQTQPVQPTAQPVADAAQNSTHVEGYSVEDYMKFMSKDVTMPELQGAPDTTGTEPTGTNGPANDAEMGAGTNAANGAPDMSATEQSNLNWFKRIFGKSEDGPAQMEASAELNDEMYGLSGHMGAEITDTALPGIIGAMHDEPSEAFKATEEQKGRLAKAWELYMRYIQVRITPFQYLMFQIFIVYGVNFIMGVFKWVGRMGIYGFHWPWSDSWKRSKKAAGNAAANTAAGVRNPTENGHSAQHNEAVRAANQPAPVPQQHPQAAPQHNPQAAPQPAPVQPVAYAMEAYRQCKQTEKLFLTGTGYPKKGSKSGNRFPELVDRFATLKAFRIYSNKHKLYGQGIAKKETEA